MERFTREERSALLSRESFFHGLPPEIISELVDIADLVTFSKGDFISMIGEDFQDVLFVVSGLIWVSVCSSSGKRITFLVVKKGEPFNLLGPYMAQPRLLEARAHKKTRCLKIKGEAYMSFVEKHPRIITNIMQWIGVSFDSAHSRILDLMEKKVENRIMRVLSTLHEKFNSPLLFTSLEISELAGTTTESTLRTMRLLRDMGIITTQRGKIWIKDPQALEDTEFGTMKI